MKTGRGFGLGLGLVLLLGCSRSGQADSGHVADTTGAAGDDVASSPVQVPTFDANAAYALLTKQVAFGPRVPGTAGHRQQLAWMLEFLRPRADSVEAQRFTATVEGRKIELANVIARFNPAEQKRVLLIAHWDTRPTADEEADEAKRNTPILGANDGASGVAVLLQLADMLSKTKAPIGVDLLFTDGEDYAPGDMYLGAKHFAANLGGYRPMYGVLIDMVGDQSPLFPIEGNSRDLAPQVVQRVYALAQEIGLGNVFPTSSGPYITDDHLPLNRAGIPTIDIIDFDYGPGNAYWHTAQDVVANTSPSGLGAVGSLLAALVYRGG